MQALSWYFVAGIVLCAMALAATLIRRLPLSTAMLYLPIGAADNQPSVVLIASSALPKRAK